MKEMAEEIMKKLTVLLLALSLSRLIHSSYNPFLYVRF